MRTVDFNDLADKDKKRIDTYTTCYTSATGTIVERDGNTFIVSGNLAVPVTSDVEVVLSNGKPIVWLAPDDTMPVRYAGFMDINRSMGVMPVANWTIPAGNLD